MLELFLTRQWFCCIIKSWTYQIYCDTGGGSFDVKEKFDWDDHSVLSGISHTGGVRALLEATAGLENRAGINPVRRIWGVCASLSIDKKLQQTERMVQK